MKTCAYILLTLALAGMVWAQKDSNLYDMLSGDSNLVVQSEQPFYGSPAVKSAGRASTSSYSEPDMPTTSTDLDSKVELIEKQITILTNCYNKMRSALQSVARKMPSQAAAATALDQNKEVFIVLNTLSDKMAQVERSIANLSSQAASSPASHGDNKEVLMVLDALANRMTGLENAMERLSSQEVSAPAPRENNKETLLVLDTMSDRMTKTENSLSKISLQIDDVAKQVAESKASAPVAGTTAMNDSETALLSREILVVVKAMSQKIDKMGMGSSTSASSQGMEDKISALESAIHQLSLQMTSLASQKPQESGASAPQNVSSDASIMNQEAMVLFKTMSEKLGKIETMLAASGAPASSPAVSEDLLISIVGAVVSPGKIKVDSTGKKDLLAALSDVGGFTPAADRTAVTVRRGPKVFTIDVERIMNENLLSFVLEGKDIVVVKEKESKKLLGSPQASDPTSALSPRIESAPAAPSSPQSKMKPKLAPQTGDILPRGDDGKDGVLQKELTALRSQ